MKEEIEVEKFKALIKEMFNGYPNYRYFKMVEDIIRTDESRKDLIDRGILIEGKYGDQSGSVQNGYALGANGLNLVSAWKNEESAEETSYYTKRIQYFTAAIFSFTLISTYFLIKPHTFLSDFPHYLDLAMAAMFFLFPFFIVPYKLRGLRLSREKLSIDELEIKNTKKSVNIIIWFTLPALLVAFSVFISMFLFSIDKLDWIKPETALNYFKISIAGIAITFIIIVLFVLIIYKSETK